MKVKDDKYIGPLKYRGRFFLKLEKRLKFIQRNGPPKGAPPRIDMPVIDSDKGDEKKASELLKKGHIDVREPYAKVKK